MKTALILVAGLDGVCLLWLLAAVLRGSKLKSGRVALYLPLPPSYLAAALIGYEIHRLHDPPLLSGFLLLWLLYCGGITAVTVRRLKRAQAEALAQMQIQRQYAWREEYYDELVKKQEQTRALWHDMEKYLHAAQAEAGSQAALDQARRELMQASDLIDVGNRVVNVILNEYQARTKAGGIGLELQVQVPETLFLPAADLYILLGNTLDNAISACLTLPPEKRRIILRLRQQYDVLFYSISNPVGEEAAPTRTGIHGYGLKNVRACVKKYGGTVEITRENGWFRLTAHMNSNPAAR